MRRSRPKRASAPTAGRRHTSTGAMRPTVRSPWRAPSVRAEKTSVPRKSAYPPTPAASSAGEAEKAFSWRSPEKPLGEQPRGHARRRRYPHRGQNIERIFRAAGRAQRRGGRREDLDGRGVEYGETAQLVGRPPLRRRARAAAVQRGSRRAWRRCRARADWRSRCRESSPASSGSLRDGEQPPQHRVQRRESFSVSPERSMTSRRAL